MGGVGGRERKKESFWGWLSLMVAQLWADMLRGSSEDAYEMQEMGLGFTL